ncbi:MAG: glycine cleavage system aminomethyltransferase GcvT [Ignavibacteriae bacterium]|nr:glycine cleavage system aminomethyltransferase GcvT [Ignavibacteriota bacterium]
MKQTPFTDIHRSLGAKLVDFAGYEMPVQYSGIIEEHLAVRNAVGVFDVSHMGEFEVSGKDALAFLQKTTINDVSKLSDGKVQYSAMCYEEGGIVDDLLVYNLGSKYLLVVNASNIQKDFEWLKSHVFGDVQLVDVSDRTALLAVQGPRSLPTLQKLTNVRLADIPYYNFVKGSIAGVPAIISRTGYTGELGYELYFDAQKQTAEIVWKAIFETGKEFGIMPVGLGARDTLRLEMGFCLYGNDIDKTTNPLEASLGWITKLEKGEFVGRGSLLKAKESGLSRRLVGLTLPDKMLARHGYAITTNGSTIGQVTSGTFSPSLQHGIALGYVAKEYASVGATVNVQVRGKDVPATIVKVPFIQQEKS